MHDFISLLDGIYDILALNDLAEDSVVPIQMRLRRMGDKKLAAVCVRS